jgi:hypothetical protein
MGSLHGVSSLMTTSGRRRRRHQVKARHVAGPYSELTTTSASLSRRARPSPRASISGVRPGRGCCHDRRTREG